MQVSIRFFTHLREITGKREETLRFPNDETVTIKLVLETLSKRYGKDFTEYAYDKKTKQPKGFLQLLVNGRGVPSEEQMDMKLSDGDVVAIIPPVGGG